MSDQKTVRICWLYPELLNIYADRGNLLFLQRRCEWRGIDFEVDHVSLGENLDPDRYDMLYLGGGQDRDQQLCAGDLAGLKRDAVHAHAERDGLVLAVCGGYQLLGESYALGEQELPGVGLLDLKTVRGESRLIGNVEIEVQLAGMQTPKTLVGFENHGGRTLLGAGQAPLGKVQKGHGNTGESGFEGAYSGSTIGTYLHGPLLPKNSWFADWLIAKCTGHSPSQLLPLDDKLELAAHDCARRATARG